MEGNVLVRVVLTPGEARSRVLCWLIGRCTIMFEVWEAIVTAAGFGGI
jgi:hypothetical protein